MSSEAYTSIDWSNLMLPLSTDLLSLTTCIGLFVHCLLRPRSERSSLFIRQIAGLSATDTLMHGAHIAKNLGSYTPLGSDTYCNVAYSVFRRSRFVSLLTEMHLALSFFLIAVCPTRNFMRPLTCVLFACWFGGIAMAMAEVFLDPAYLSPGHVCVLRDEDTMTIFTICITSGMCLLAYIAVTWKMSKVRSAVAKQALCMLALYPLNVVWTYGCIVGVYTLPSDWTHSNVLYLVSLTNEGLGGFLNVLVYWLGARSLSLTLFNSSTSSAAPLCPDDSMADRVAPASDDKA